MALNYFNIGFKIIAKLALQYKLLQYYGVDPGLSTQMLAIIDFPWVPKLLYGFLTDNVPILGSTKLNYMMVMCLLQCSMQTAAIMDFSHVYYLVAVMTVSELSEAINDCVCDGLMVV
jgi:multisubunit Na+/H+ antiporter MnhF subunit